ncbi:MAG: hypothetical protein H6R15_1487 [Proteobacteria bacterium]|nr:hypothetical protein [Pseudomonadota bacterium]
MNISFEGGIAVSGLVPITPSPTSKVMLDGGLPFDIRTLADPTQAELDAQIRRQNAEPVRAVFRVNGEVVATMQSLGTTFFSNSVNFPHDRELSFSDVETALRRRYGSALQVESYSGGNGPTQGAILAEVYGGKGYLVNTQA